MIIGRSDFTLQHHYNYISDRLEGVGTRTFSKLYVLAPATARLSDVSCIGLILFIQYPGFGQKWLSPLYWLCLGNRCESPLCFAKQHTKQPPPWVPHGFTSRGGVLPTARGFTFTRVILKKLSKQNFKVIRIILV